MHAQESRHALRPLTGVRGALLGGLVLILAACGGGKEAAEVPPPPETTEGVVVERSRSEQVAADRRERERQRLAARAGETGFVYARYEPDLEGDQPKACLVFSQALDPKQDYSVYVTLREDITPAYSVEGQKLCLGGLSFSSNYTATLREGLPAGSGELLGREESVSISFEDRPPYVGFRGSGIILPREDADGLAVETVNVEQVNVTVSRVNDRVLAFKSLTKGEEASQGSYAYVYGDENPADVSTELWSGTMAIDSVRNAPVVTVFPLPDVIETLEPGAYYVEIADDKELGRYDGPPASAKRWIMLTDLALTAYRSAGGLDVTLRSLQDGRAMQNTSVQLIAHNNEVLGQAATGVDGRVNFNAELLAGTGNLAPKIVLAKGLKGDTAVLDLTRAPVDLSELETGGRTTPGMADAYLYTERGIYRPGETVHLTAMVRDRAGRALNERAGTLITFRPNGMEAAKERFLTGEDGAIQRDIALPRDAARGVWRSVIEIDGMKKRAGAVSYSVEDFVPQRIAVELETDKAPFLPGDDIRVVEVTSRFLYGAPGAGLTVQSQARIEPDPSPFETWEGYRWGAHTTYFNEQILRLDDQTTDGEGKASVRISPDSRTGSADRPLRINTVVSVLEPGGRAVTESVRIPYRPNALYLGIKPGFEGRLARDEAASFDIAAVDAAGAGLAQDFSWKVLEIDYHYDWYRENGNWRWRKSRTVRTVNEGSGTTAEGVAQVPVSGLDWGEHELIIEAGKGVTASRNFYVGWGGVSDEGVEAPDRVQVSVVDEDVVSGRPAAIAIVPPYDGEAQIVVATDRILSVETRQVSAEGTEITLPVSDDWGEGAYVMVNVYTPRDPVVQSRPRRAVGLAYVPVNMDSRTFDLTIDAPELVRPNREQTITVELKDGPNEKAFVTLAAVDEGILRLTKFSSPDPTDWYFGKKALGMSLYDDYGRLLDPNLGLPAEVRSGGDQLGGEGLSVVPVKSIALFSGIVEVGRGGKADITFETPDFNGELRLMAVAWSKTGLGAADQAMTVRERAPSDLILPRFMAPGDDAVATLSIDNIELAKGAFTTVLSTEGVLDVPVDEISATIPQGQRADQSLKFSAEGAGISSLRLSVNGPEDFAVSREYQIETRSPYLPVTRISKTLMEENESFEPDMSLLDGLIAGSEAVTVSFSGLPVDPNALYHSLARYPYGCTEQTTSRALPLIYSENLVDEGADGSRQSARPQVQEAVTRILNRQSSNGAFGLWREGDGYASPWLGAYTTDFIYRAKEAGYEVPQAALDQAYQSMRGIAEGNAWRVYGYHTDVYESRWHSDTEKKLMLRASPYALYVLARAGKADISRLRYLHDRELGEMRSPLARAHLAAALSYMGDRSRAFSAFDAAEDALGYENSGDYYQTPLRDLSGVLALAAETGFTEHVTRLAEKLGEDVPEPDELTTQEKAYLLLAVGSLSQEDGLRLDVKGLGSGNNNDRRYFLTADQIENEVSFRLKRGSSPVFRTVMVTGAPESAPPPASESLSVSKSIRSLTGGQVNLSRITQGDQLVVAIKLTPKERRNNPVIVADLLPAGFEIETVLKPADGKSGKGGFSWVGDIDYAQTEEARDDRFVAAIDVVSEPRTLAYVVRAVTPGSFAMPGVVAEDMYRPDVFARSASANVVITPKLSGPSGSK